MTTDHYSDFEKLFAHGLLTDYFHALRHFKTYSTINNNINYLLNTSIEKQNLAGYIQNTSLQLTVLHLSKIYDKTRDRPDSKTRSIHTILKEILKIIKENQNITLADNKWSRFLQTNNKIIANYDSLDKSNPLAFINSIVHIFSTLSEENEILSRLKALRNKRLAHNTSYINSINITNEELQDLLDYTSLVVKFTNNFVLTKITFVDPIISTKHLDLIIPKIKKTPQN